MTRPDAGDALLELAQGKKELPAAVLKARCDTCKKLAGRVFQSPHGLLWLGYLRNAVARQFHGGEEPLLPCWLDPGTYVEGECRCTVSTDHAQPWPAWTNRSHRITADVLLGHPRAGRRVLTL